MKFLHTSDLHLGRTLFTRSLTHDQSLLLKRLREIAEETRPDALVVAGDFFDRANPGRDAYGLAGEFTELFADIPTLMVAGNHDNKDMLAFAASLGARDGWFFRTDIRDPDTLRPVRLAGVNFWLLPWFTPGDLRAWGGTTDMGRTTNELAGPLFDAIRARPEFGDAPNVLVAHLFTKDSTPTQDEMLKVGSAGLVKPDRLAGFDYVALGHIHAACEYAGGRIRYCGTPLAMGPSQANTARTVSLVTVEPGHPVSVEPIVTVPAEAAPDSPPPRPLHFVKASFQEMLSDEMRERHAGCYLLAKLSDPSLVPGSFEKLRRAYPYLCDIALSLEDEDAPSLPEEAAFDAERQTPEQLLASYWKFTAQQRALTPEMTEAFRKAYDMVLEDTQ